MENIANYKDRFSGRIFLIGNGPSLLENDLSNLEKEEIMTMNRSGRDIPNTKFHLASGDLTVLGTKPEYVIFYGQESMYPAPRLRNINSPVILIRGCGPGQHFKKQADWGIPREFDLRYGWPVTSAGHLAIVVAWWMGYNPIYLLGYDGYGTHYTDRHGGMYRPEHEKIVPQFVTGINKLLKFDSRLEVINLNPDNKYGNLPVSILDKLESVCYN